MDDLDKHQGPLADVARTFESIWSSPTPETLAEALHPDVTLYQPAIPVIRGKDNAYKEFKRLLTWLPGLYGKVDKSISTDELISVEWKLIFPIGRRGIHIPIVDLLTVKDGKIFVRKAYFDQQPIVLAVLMRPLQIVKFIRYRFKL